MFPGALKFNASKEVKAKDKLEKKKENDLTDIDIPDDYVSLKEKYINLVNLNSSQQNRISELEDIVRNQEKEIQTLTDSQANLKTILFKAENLNEKLNE